jgi:hypothetical protein
MEPTVKVKNKTEKVLEWNVDKCFHSLSVNNAGAVCDQTSKFFVSHREEPMAGHVAINGVY